MSDAVIYPNSVADVDLIVVFLRDVIVIILSIFGEWCDDKTTFDTSSEKGNYLGLSIA